MRYPASAKLELIELVERSHLPAKQTLDILGVARTTFYRWYERYRLDGEKALQDKAYDTAGFVAKCRAIAVTPHVAQNNTNRASAIDARTTRHGGYAVSQIIRKLIETIFGDAKEHGRLRQLKVRGLSRAQQMFTLAMTVVNLRRLPRLFEASG